MPKIADNKNQMNLVFQFAFRGVSTLASTVAAWQETAKQRRELLELDGRMLRDIGVTREHAMEEAARPFWDGPVHLQRQKRRRFGYGFFGIMARRQFGG